MQTETLGVGQLCTQCPVLARITGLVDGITVGYVMVGGIGERSRTVVGIAHHIAVGPVDGPVSGVGTVPVAANLEIKVVDDIPAYESIDARAKVDSLVI